MTDYNRSDFCQTVAFPTKNTKNTERQANIKNESCLQYELAIWLMAFKNNNSSHSQNTNIEVLLC